VGSIDVPAGLLEEVVHHDAVPQLDVVVPELGVGGELHPVVLYHSLQRNVATESGQPALTSDLLDVAADDVVHSVLLEGAVLVPDHLELTVDLPQQEAPLEELEGEVVELENLEVAPHEEGVRVGPQLTPGNLGKDPPADLDNHPGNIERKEVDNFIDRGCAGDEVAPAQKLEHLDELVGGEVAVVELLVEVVDDFEEALLEELVPAELIGLDLELLAHHFGQLVDQELVALELNLLVALDALVPGCVEQVEGGDCVGVEPEDDRQGELGEGHEQDDGVGDELDHVDLDAVAFCQFVAGELVVDLRFIEVGDPLDVVPEVLGSLHEGVLGLLEDELGLEQQRLLAVGEELLLELLHLMVVQQSARILVR
jgi:hypothetical protein